MSSDLAFALRGVGTAVGGNFALRDVSFELPAGYVMGLIGANGAGKTTTIRCLLGMRGFETGEIELLPALALLMMTVAAYPFNVADKAGLETLYAVLPLPRRSVVYGHYAWAVASYLVAVAVGTALDFLLARVEAAPFSGRTFLTMLTLSWALFAVNVAIQFPMLIRFGYTRISVLGTTLPLLLVVAVITRLHLTTASIQTWLPLLGAAGVAAITASAAGAITADRRRVRYSGPERDDRTSRDQYPE